MIKLSVIVPVYNVEKYLPRCLDSLVNQTLKDIEIICVNDGSTDKSLKILEKYAEKDSRFKIINQNNSGLGNARNTGMNIAKGDYIAFVDSDDWIEIDAFEYLYNTAVKVNANILMFNHNVVSDINTAEYSNNDFIKKVGHNLGEIPYFITKELKENILEISPAVWDKIYKRKFIEDNNISFPNVYMLEDFIFTLNACCFGEKVYYVDKYFYNYYQRINSIVHLYFDPSLSLFDAVLLIQEFFDKYFPELSKEAKDYNFRSIVHAYLSISRFDFKTGRKFKEKYREIFGNESYEKFLQVIKEHRGPFYCQIFSVKNRFYRFKKKEITILGFKFMFEKKMKN